VEVALNRVFQALIIYVPGPALAWINDWTKILQGTILANEMWQAGADKTAAAIASFIVVLLAIEDLHGGGDKPLSRLYYLKRICIILTTTCIAIYLILGSQIPITWQYILNDVWLVCYIALVVCAASLLTMTIRKQFTP
jgi:Na+(H+)/acetate symporter ActP